MSFRVCERGVSAEIGLKVSAHERWPGSERKLAGSFGREHACDSELW